jgi:hypothetical protein
MMRKIIIVAIAWVCCLCGCVSSGNYHALSSNADLRGDFRSPYDAPAAGASR